MNPAQGFLATIASVAAIAALMGPTQNNPAVDFDATLQDIHALPGIKFTFIGGYAVHAHGYHRTTVDIDILVEDGEKALDHFVGLGYEQVGQINYRYVLKHKTRAPVDILFPGMTGVRIPEGWREDHSRPISIERLLEMKVFCGRMKDEADIVELLKAVKCNPQIGEAARARMADKTSKFDALFARALEELGKP